MMKMYKKTLIIAETVSHLDEKVVIWLDVFVKSIKNHEVFDGHFSKSMCFSAGEPRAMGRNLVRPNEYSIHMEVRTLYARRMFREIQYCMGWACRWTPRASPKSTCPYI